MDQDPNAPLAPPETKPAPQGGALVQSGAGHIDITKVLLPKKEAGPSPLSAQRINAGLLLEQEQSATLMPEEKPPAPTEPNVPAQAAPAEPAKPKEEELSEIKPLQTYRSDIEEVIHGTNASVVSIAAAEAQRRAQGSIETPSTALGAQAPEARRNIWGRVAMVGGGLVLLGAAAGLGAFVYVRTLTVEPAPAPASPFLSVDETRSVAFQQNQFTRTALMQGLEQERLAVALPVGLVARIVPRIASSTGEGVEVGAPRLLQTLAPNAPEELLRTLDPVYLLGVHSFDSNQAFVALRVDSYQVAYAAMLRWEYYLQQDLAPLFSRTPSPRINDQVVQGSTTTTPFIQTGFVDKIVENHDARVIENAQGDILLLWTFLDRNTLVITTNEYTLREIISRTTTASLLSQPGL